MFKNKLHLRFFTISLLVTVVACAAFFLSLRSGADQFLQIILAFFLLINSIYFAAYFSLKKNDPNAFVGAVLAGSTIKLFVSGGLFYLFFVSGEKEVVLSKIHTILLFFILYAVYSSVLYFFLLKMNNLYQKK